jgi:hypothetical protein
VLIEQAIFTSANTDRAQGYQLVSRSPGLSEADARELAVWGPSHDSLLERPGGLSSTNLFKLISGAYCVSRTQLAGAEYSGRGGEVVQTRFLVVPAEVFARFGNNAFAVVRAATAIGAFEVLEHLPETLEPLTLGGRSAPVDLALLAQLAREPGPAAMATLIQAALASDRLAIAAETPCEHLIAGLVNTLPVECRTEFSFSTGLKYSPSRPIRISCLPGEPSNWRATARGGVTLLDLTNSHVGDGMCWKGWAGCVARIFRSGKLSLLACELEQPRPWLNCTNVNALGEQIEANSQAGPRSEVTASINPGGGPGGAEAAATVGGSARQRADRAHVRLEAVLSAAQGAVNRSWADKLAKSLAGQPPEVLELLERIDDLVFTAISGDDRALAELEVLWPTVVAQLDEDLVEQSREQYLRCALSICGESTEDRVQRPERAVSAIDVLCVLFDE